jgi:hypothetical protein
MGWAFLSLGICFTISTLFGSSKNTKDDSTDSSKFSIVQFLEYFIRVAAFFMIGGAINDSESFEIDNTNTILNGNDAISVACTSHYDDLNYSLLPSQEPKMWATLAYVFGTACLIELVIHMIDFTIGRESKMVEKISQWIEKRPMAKTIIAVFRRSLTAFGRLFACMFIAGVVMERSMTACNPFVDLEDSKKFKTMIVLTTVSFIPALFSQQLEWDSDVHDLQWVFEDFKKAKKMLWTGARFDTNQETTYAFMG